MRTLFKEGTWWLLTIGLIFSFAACEDAHEDARKTNENKSSTMYLKAKSGNVSFKIASNKAWKLSMDDDSKKWASITSSTEGNGDATIDIKYDDNDGFNRMGVVLIHMSKKSVTDTLYLKQQGETPAISFVENEISSPNFGLKSELKVLTNIPTSYIKDIVVKATYQDTEESWVSETKLSENLEFLSFQVVRNLTFNERHATLEASYTDGWGDKYAAICTISQSKSVGTAETKKMSFEELRQLITSAEGILKIDDEISLEGIVISDNNNPNVASNPNIANHSIDYEVNKTTAYVQNTKGDYGFALRTNSSEDNIMHRYDKVELFLQGLTLVKEANPERYTITDITHGNYMNVESGSSSNIPANKKHINQLTDNDLYTFVTLTDCELPIHKGSFTPINEGYGIVFGVSRVDKYPLLVRDINGSSTFLMTNLGCEYKRNGTVLPQGSGDISGIIVHETYDRFERDGNIGKYQIRHLALEDIAIAQNKDESYSKLICEWTKFQGTSKLVTPTFGSGELWQTYTAGNMYGTLDYNLLGPVGDEKGINPSSDAGGIGKTMWWQNNTGDSWIIKLSTAGISSNQLSLQLAAFHATALGAPRYWVVETSTHGNLNGTWDKVKEYTIPDVVQWNNTLPEQLSGWKNMNFSLPTSLLGKPEVYIRLRVTANKAGNASTYDGVIINNNATTSLSYISVRYNK